jgi:hypothetical protein
MIQIYSGLWVVGEDLDPDAIVSALGGLQPDSARRLGDLKPNGRPFPQGHVWFTTANSIRTRIEESLDDLFAKLDPVWPALTGLSLVYSVSIECYVKLYDRAPSEEPYLGFEARHVNRAAQLHSELGIDLQDYRGTRVEPDRPTK